MSPIDRLDWLAALAATDAPACALQVAIVLAKHTNSETGQSWPGLRNALGVDAAKRGARWLTTTGWIQVVEVRSGKPVIYCLTRGSTAPGATLHPVQSCPQTRGTAAPGPGAVLPPEPGIPSIEPGSDASDLPAMTLKSGQPWQPSEALLQKLHQAHPDIDIDGELSKASLWLEANPTKRKTASGMPRFLAGWIGRATETPNATPSLKIPTYAPPSAVGDFLPEVYAS